MFSSSTGVPLKTRFRNWLRMRVVPTVVYALYVALRSTWRISFDECPAMRDALDNRRPFIMAHWHGEEEFVERHLVRRFEWSEDALEAAL